MSETVVDLKQLREMLHHFDTLHIAFQDDEYPYIVPMNFGIGDDKDKIVWQLYSKQKLYARKLQLKEVNIKDTNEFLDAYHLQNSCYGNTVNLGLYQDEELIQVMTFGKPRYNSHYQWELLRLCTKSEYYVVGGAEKLFKHFIRDYNPESIISYCDMSKFTGDVYLRLGFKQTTKPQPREHWCITEVINI